MRGRTMRLRMTAELADAEFCLYKICRLPMLW
jgi:hypothetical protein